MARVGKKHDKKGVPRDAPKTHTATFSKNKTSGRNEVDNVRLEPVANNGDTVVLANKIGVDVVVLLWAKKGDDIVLIDPKSREPAGVEITKEVHAVFLPAHGTPPTFATAGDLLQSTHYKVIVHPANHDGNIGGDLKQIIDSGGGADPEIIIGG